MSRYGSGGGTAAKVIAVILALLLIASVTLALGDHFGGWFDKADTEITDVDDTDTTQDDGTSTEDGTEEDTELVTE